MGTIVIKQPRNSITVESPNGSMTFRTGPVVTVTTPFVSADQKLFMNGVGGDSYFLFNSATQMMEVWVNGELRTTWGAPW